MYCKYDCTRTLRIPNEIEMGHKRCASRGTCDSFYYDQLPLVFPIIFVGFSAVLQTKQITSLQEIGQSNGKYFQLFSKPQGFQRPLSTLADHWILCRGLLVRSGKFSRGFPMLFCQVLRGYWSSQKLLEIILIQAFPKPFQSKPIPISWQCPFKPFIHVGLNLRLQVLCSLILLSTSPVRTEMQLLLVRRAGGRGGYVSDRSCDEKRWEGFVVLLLCVSQVLGWGKEG